MAQGDSKPAPQHDASALANARCRLRPGADLARVILEGIGFSQLDSRTGDVGNGHPRDGIEQIVAAILAVRTTLFGGDLTAAIRSMTRIIESYSPLPELLEKYERAYQQLRAACTAHGCDD